MIACGAVLLAALEALPANAADAGAPDALGAGRFVPDDRIAFRVDYVAPAGCPDAAAFSALVRERTTRVREADEGESAQRLRVELRIAEGGASGQLTAERDGETSDVRTLRGRTCADVVSALALTAALSLDPSARFSLPTPPPAPAPTPARAPTNVVPVAPLARWTRARVGATAGLARIVSPGVMPFAGVAGEVEATRWWRPAVRLSLLGASNALATDRAATFSWIALELEACPFQLPLGARAALAPCGAAQGGLLRASGRGEPTVYTESRLWTGAGAAAHLSVAISPRWAIDLGAGTLIPFQERDFRFEDPTRSLARTAAISWRAGLGASWAFP
jgi:hypothetical protein